MIQTETHHAQHLETAPGALRDDLSPDTEKVIIIGEDSVSPPVEPAHGAEVLPPARLQAVLDSYFDSYVAFANAPSETYEYHLGKRFPLDSEVHYEENRAEAAQAMLADLSRYVHTAFAQGQLAVEASELPNEGIVTIESISNAATQRMLARAQERYEASVAAALDTTQYPAHISPEIRPVETPDDRTFGEIIRAAGESFRGLGGRALGLLLVSGPIQTVTQTTPTVAMKEVEIER